MFEDIFGKPLHRSRITLTGQLQSLFDSEILRRCILKIVGASGLLEADVETITAAAKSPGGEKYVNSLWETAAAKVRLDDGVKRGCHT